MRQAVETRASGMPNTAQCYVLEHVHTAKMAAAATANAESTHVTKR